MKIELIFSQQADQTLTALEQDHSSATILKAVLKVLTYMQEDLHHPSLHTHEYHGISGPNGEKIFEAYAQQHTPGAYRIFWHYGPEEHQLTIISIVPHPD